MHAVAESLSAAVAEHISVAVADPLSLLRRLLTGKTSRTVRGLDAVSKPMNVDELGKRQRKKKKARVASPEPDAASQCNSNGHQSTATVSSCK